MATFVGIFLGVILGRILWSLVIAVGYLIFGLLLGYRFNLFNFWGMMVLEENGKLKFRFTNFSLTAICGMKGMREGDRTFSRQAVYEILVWLMGLAVVMGSVVVVLFLIVAKKPVTAAEYIKIGVPGGMFTSCLFHLIHLIQTMVQVFGKGERSVLWRAHQEAMNRLDEGVRPMDLRLSYEKTPPAIKVDGTYKQYRLLKYYSALDAKKYEQLEKYIREFGRFIPEVWNVMDTPYYYELIFYHCYITGDMQRAESIMTMVRDALIADKDVNGRRVYAYYLYYSGKDKNIALQTAREGLQVADSFYSKGIAQMERELLQELIDKIESE